MIQVIKTTYNIEMLRYSLSCAVVVAVAWHDCYFRDNETEWCRLKAGTLYNV